MHWERAWDPGTRLVKHTSTIIVPLSAIIDIPGLSLSVVKYPVSHVSLTSDMEPTNTGETKGS